MYAVAALVCIMLKSRYDGHEAQQLAGRQNSGSAYLHVVPALFDRRLLKTTQYLRV